MKKESIKLSDFLIDAIKSFKIPKKNIPKSEAKTRYVCSKCNKGYNEDDSFCSKDGAEIIKENYTIEGEEYESFVRNIFYSFDGAVPKDFPYEYVDSIEKRGDGDGYWMNFIFKRKSDEKFFYYTSYDGRIEEDELRETFQNITVKWDFEDSFD